MMATTRELSGTIGRLYADAPLAIRTLQRLRPFICPFDAVIAQVPRGSRVLDVGSGAGTVLLLLAHLGQIEGGHGFDVSRAAIAAACTAARRLGRPGLLSFETREVSAGIPTGDWDVITIIDVLHHVPPRAQLDLIRELARRVPVGGRLVVKDMAPRPLWRSAMNQLHDLVLARQWVHHIDAASVTEAATGEGLVLIHRSAVNLLWYGHWMTVFQRP